MQEAHLLRHLLDVDLVALAQQRQTLAIALLQRREQGVAKAANLAASSKAFWISNSTAHRAERLVQAADDRADVDPGCCRFDQHARVERRIEER